MTLREIIGRAAAWRQRVKLERDLADDLRAHVKTVERVQLKSIEKRNSGRYACFFMTSRT